MPFFRFSSNTFTGAHQNTLENVPCSCPDVGSVLTHAHGAYNIVGNFTGLSSALSVIQFLQQRHAGFGVSLALCTRYAMAVEILKRYLFLCKVGVGAKSESYS
jgi:hypothetical protein